MESKIQKWGNSNGVRIPKAIMEALNLKQNDIVEITNNGDKIVIAKSSKNTLKERIEKYNGPNLCSDFEWDGPVGKEIW